MTTTTERPPQATSAATRGDGALTGTAVLVRLMLRRDRIKLPAWTGGIAVFAVYYGAALPTLFPTTEDLQAAGSFASGPVGALMGGPGYGFDDLTIERFLVGQYGLYFLLIAAVMSIVLVGRHTRVEEQTGRSELVRANVVGRHAPLTGALIVALITNVILALLIWGAMVAVGFEAGGSLLFGAGIGAAGLAFAGVTAAAVQVTEHSRAAAGLAGAALAMAYVIRAVGDLLGDHGSLLSWFSPLAWSQQTRAFVDDRWWPLLLSLGFAAAMSGVGYALSIRRDVGAGLVAARPGPAEAADWLRSPSALAWRLQRGSIYGWSVALGVTGLLYGWLTDPLVDAFDQMSDELLAIMGGQEDLLSGYLGLMGFFMALVVGVYAVLAVQAIRAEETRGRTEPVLATATSRAAALGSSLGVTAVAVLWLLLVAGFTTGVGAAIGTGDAGLVWDVTVAHVVHTPGVLVVLALAALLYGAVPRAVPLAWAVLLHALIVGFFGPVLGPPDWLVNLSPLMHIAQMPLEDFVVTPMAILAVLVAGVTALALWTFGRRDLLST